MATAMATAPALPPPPYAIALTAGGKVLRFALAPLAAVSTRKGRLGGAARPGVQGRPGRGRRGDRRLGERLPGDPSGAGADLPGHRGQHRRRRGQGRRGDRLDAKDRVIGFVLANKKREGLTVRTNRGATQIVRATKYPVTGRGGKGYAILQRGSLDAVVPDEAEPVPSVGGESGSRSPG